jgi:CBS domain-containing protein
LFRSPALIEEAAVKVIDILAAKGGDVIGIEPAATLETAAKLLSKHRIGAVVIRGAGGRLAGILSERDIVRAVAREGAEALSAQVAQVMTRDVVTCVENDTCAEIMERMTAHKFRHLPVLRDNALIGLISIGDVVKQRVEEIEQESEAMRDYIRSA